MAATLRHLLIQRAARLQERPALTAPGWPTLTWSAWRNRVEGVGLGLLAEDRPVGARIHAATGTPWDWATEVAAACCGLVWDESGPAPSPDLYGGGDFNADAGRGPFHDREHELAPETPFCAGLNHAALLSRLQRLNRSLGWDHAVEVHLPLSALGRPETRAALWSALYAGAHTRLDGADPRSATDLAPFSGFWSA